MDNLNLQSEDEDLVHLKPDRTNEGLNGSNLEDEEDEKWRNWQVDDPDPSSCDERDADDVHPIARAFHLCWENPSHMFGKELVFGPNVTSLSIVRKRTRITLFYKGKALWVEVFSLCFLWLSSVLVWRADFYWLHLCTISMPR